MKTHHHEAVTMNGSNEPKKHEAARLLKDARDLIRELGWSRSRYIERDSHGAPTAFDIMGALQFATVSGNYRRAEYLLAKQHLEAACKPWTLRAFNRMVQTRSAVLRRYEVAIGRLHQTEERTSVAVVIPFDRARRAAKA